MAQWDRADRHVRNMSDMMQRIGLDQAAVAQQRLGLTLAHAIRTCRNCSAGETCTDWLARAPATLPQAPAFCPNRELFAQLREDTPQPAESG